MTIEQIKGQLHSTDGSTFAESVTYAYNPRGWLVSGSSPKFSQTLDYEGADSGAVRQYSGNISRQGWQHSGQPAQYYSYTYDRLGRLLTGTGGSRSEAVTYDSMGNILTLKRDAGAVWTYGYTAAQGNRLQTITGGGATYLYDGNGNMTRDGRANRAVTYNELDLPKTVGGTAASYTYDATGRKLRSVISGTATDYIDGIEWQGGTLNAIHMEEGRILPTGVYQYVLRDHLGNTRSGFASSATGTVNVRSDYYPFGLQHPAGNVVPTPKNRYLYNGKELQDGSGYYDYGARFYDPVIGRWGSVDPLAEKMQSWSPYAYGFDNPLKFIDVGGLYPWPVMIRSFISSPTAGGGRFYGDGRGASFSGTSRVYSSFVVDPSQRNVSQPITRSDPTIFYGAGIPGQLGYLPPDMAVGEPLGSNDNISFSGGKASFDFSHAGKDPLTPGLVTPELDLHANLTFAENLKEGVLSINGSFTGDVFPSSEAFITDQSGKTKLFLGAKMERGGLLNLYGDNKEPLFKVNMQVTFDSDGNFTGVRQGKQNYTIEEWNKKIQEEFNR